MNDIQKRLEKLRVKKWTDAAIADEIGYGRVTVARWRSGQKYPSHANLVLMALDGLLKRKNVPKQRRYGKSE